MRPLLGRKEVWWAGDVAGDSDGARKSDIVEGESEAQRRRGNVEEGGNDAMRKQGSQLPGVEMMSMLVL